MPSNWIFWVLFNVFVLVMLALDLGVFHRQKHVVEFREAIGWTMAWIILAVAFAVLIYFFGHAMTGHHNRPNSELTLEFVTGYLIEESLSVDNLFVFLIIFRYFAVPRKYQHEVLFWGVVGALVMRGVFILVGIKLLNAFEWIIYVFGAILIYSGVKLFRQQDERHRSRTESRFAMVPEAVSRYRELRRSQVLRRPPRNSLRNASDVSSC